MSAVTAPTNTRAIITRRMRARRTTDQIGRVLVLFVLLLTAGIFLFVPYAAFTWLSNPFPGVLVEYPRNVNPTQSAVGETWTGWAQGLKEGDEITAIDGQPVQSARDIARIMRAHSVDDLVSLDVVSAETGAQSTINVRLMRMPLGDVLTLFGVPYVVGLAFLAIGLWVYRNRRDQDIGRVFILTCCALALVLGLVFDLWTTNLFMRLWVASVPLAAGMLMTFALLFPNEVITVADRPTLRWLPLIPAVLLIIFVQVLLTGANHDTFASLLRTEYLFGAAGIVAFLGALVARAFFSSSPAVREQSRVVLAGSTVAFLPFLIWYVNPLAISILPVLAMFVLFPLVIAYSIIQYSMIDTGRLMSIASTYSIMGVVLVAGYALIVAGLSFVMTAAIGDIAASPIIVGLLVFALVVAFQPARERVQGTIDRFFFKSRAEYQDRLTDFRHDLTNASGLSEIVRLLKEQLRETLVPTHVYVFLRDAQTGEFAAAGEGARPDTDIRFEPQSGLVHALSTTRDVIFLEPNRPLPPEMVEDHARLAVLRTPVMSALQGQDRLAGFVAVGPKRSGETFEIQDLRFVEAIAEQASLAVERAQVIGDLERRVRELDVLSQVSQAVNFTTDPDVLLELIFTHSSKLIDTTNFYIITHHKQHRTLSYAFFVENDDRNDAREGIHWPDDEGLESEVVRTGRPIRTNDYMTEVQRLRVRPREPQPYAWMGVPLNAGANTLGVMVVNSFTKGVTFTEDQLKIFWAIADQAATALDKARLFTETETRARQLATLNEISKELSSTLDLENLLVRIMRAAVEILGTEAGTLFLIDDSTNELVFRVVEGGAQNLVGTRLPAGVGIVGEAAVSGQPVIVNNVMQDRRWFSDVDRETEFQTQSLLAVPLRIQDQSIGVLEVINKGDGTAFAAEDISLLTTFAAQASVAIQNARLYEATDAELAARVDELQNLQRIDRELNRTLRLDRVVQITLDWALRTTGASAGAVVMLDPEVGVQVLAGNGYRTDFAEKGTVPDHGIIGRVLHTGKPEFIRDVANDEDFMSYAEIPPEQQIAVPLLRANQGIGALILETQIPGLLGDHDFEFIQRLVEHAAVAIENARLLKEVEDANRSKTEFISFVAHELKNPMTSIRGYTDLLKGGQVGPVNDMQVQFLSTVRSNVDRMTRLVSDLADVARIEANQLRLELSPIPVSRVVDETLRAIQGQITEKNQELVVELPDDLPMIHADHLRMVQIMTNLVSNAHKYTPDGGTIWVGGKAETITSDDGNSQDVVHHWVRDTGIGMAPDELEQLFQKFFRTQRGKDMAQGTGLGLNITKNLVERHEGTIWVESEVGHGTSFHFTIPVAKEVKAEAE
jgi:signal transduction histidine kinase